MGIVEDFCNFRIVGVCGGRLFELADAVIRNVKIIVETDVKSVNLVTGEVRD